MPRNPRIDYEGAWHHVVNRGAARAKVFECDADYELFLKSLELACERYGVEVHAYCLMGNHYHLLLKSLRGQLADTMRFLAGRFTRLKNLRESRDGAIFRGRYHAAEIGDDSHLIQALRYIHLNPVEARLVQSAEDWRWSSAGLYCGGGAPHAWVTKCELLEMFGPGNEREKYCQFIREGIDEATKRRYAALDEGI